MKTTEAILTRRSIRQYENKSVPESYYEDILKAGMYAPSAMNLQPWEFIIADNPESVNKFIKSVPHSEKILKTAAGAILVCGNNKVEQNIDYLIQNCSACIQNMLLQAHESGLGACWIAVYPLNEVIESLRMNFNLPDYILPVALMSLGYPSEEVAAEERYIRDKIHFNTW